MSSTANPQPQPRHGTDAAGGGPPAAPGTADTRRTDLEALRVLAMATVFLAHCMQVFVPWVSWHIQNADRSEALGQIALFAWPWVMPLFMLLAGAGASLSLGRRTDEQFGYERTLRLLVPFVAGTLLLVPPQIYVERLAQARFAGSFLEFYPTFFECCYPDGNLAAGHLWFIGYLWVYSIASVPLLRTLSGERGEPWRARVSAVCDRPAGVLWFAAPVVATQLLLRGEFPQSYAFFDDWAAHALLFLAFLYGCLSIAEPDLLGAVDRQWRVAIAPAAGASVWIALVVASADRTDPLPATYDLRYLLFWTAFGVAAWSWIVVLIGAMRHWVRGRSRALHYASRSVYGTYIIHQTVIVIAAYFVVRWNGAIAMKFAALVAISLAVTGALNELGRRWRATRLLLGWKVGPHMADEGPVA